MKTLWAKLVAFISQFFKSLPLPDEEPASDSIDSGTGFGDT